MLTEKSIKEIETATGIKGLQEIIKSEENLDVVLTKTKHFDETSYNQLYQNLTSELSPAKYEEAKKAGEEMAVKAIKREKDYEFEGKSVKSLIDYIDETNTKITQTNISEREIEIKKDNDFLKSKLLEKEGEIKSINDKRKHDRINAAINNHFNSLRIEVPAQIKDKDKANLFVKTELEKNKAYFKTQYTFDVDENNNIITKDLSGEILKNEVRSPIEIENLVNNFVNDSFMNLKQDKIGRGDGDIYPSENLTGIQTLDELKEYAMKKGIKQNTQEFDSLYIEFNKKT